MNTIDSNGFHRAFRLHPRLWREQNEAVAVGVLMDVAESSGRAQLRLLERASLYLHAASVWAERILTRTVRTEVASLSLGTGIALSVIYLTAFVFVPVLEGTLFAVSKAIMGSVLVAPWVIAGVLSVAGYLRATRFAIGAALAVCFAIMIFRLGLPELGLPSTLTVLFLGLSAALASLSRVRWSLVWKTALVVGVPVAAVAHYSGLIGSPVDSFLWTQLAYMLLFALSGLAICLITLAACSYKSMALAGTLYAAPWAVLMIAGYVRGGTPTTLTIPMAAIWVCVSCLVVGISHFRERRPHRSTFVR